MLNTPFSPWPSFTSEEADAVSRVLLSNKVNYWTGQECRQFEQEFAQWTGTQHAIAVTNGTVALDLALNALSIGQGDEVIVTSRTFLASVSSIVNAGATPVFADIDLDSQNICAKTIQSVLTPKTKAIICVHLAGWMCDMDPIMALAQQHQLWVVEDCAQAHGAYYKGRAAGSIGHIGAWSFCQDKIMTTGGEGGMVTTNNAELWKIMWSYKDHGKNWDTVYNKQHPSGFRWLHESFGTNWRMMEMQAVIGRIQLTRMLQWSKKRQENAEKILEACKQHDIFRVPMPDHQYKHAYYRAYFFVQSEYLKPDWSRDRVIQEMNNMGVPCYSGSCSEVYLEKAFDNTSFRPKNSLPHAKQLGEDSVMLLVHPTLTDIEIQKTIKAIHQVAQQAGR